MPKELATILQGISTISGWVAFAIILIALHRSGVLASLLSFLKKNGNGNFQIQIDELKEHSHIANEEMGKIREDISEIKADISFIRGKLS